MKSKSVQRGALTTTKKNTRLPSRCFSPPSLPAPLSPGSGRDPATGTGRGTAKPPPAAFPRTHPDPPATSPRRNGGAERGTPPAGKRSPGPPCPRGPPADKGGRRDRGGAPRERLSAPPGLPPGPALRAPPRSRALPAAPAVPIHAHRRRNTPPARLGFFFRPTPQSASTPTRHPRVVHAAQSIIPPTPPKKKKKRKSPDEQPQLCRRCQSPLPTERIERCSLPTPPPPLRDPPARDGPGAARAPSTFPARGRQRNAARAAPRGSAQRRKIRAESRNAKSGGGEEINCKEKKKKKIRFKKKN